MLVELCAYIVIICAILGSILWFAEETKIGRKLTSWLLNKILGTHFEHLD